MNFYDLIVSMEQAAFRPRPVVGAIVVVSGLAVSFLLWLLYGHHASADFAGRWMFLPALNALLNGLCAIALCVGLYFIKHHNKEAHRTSMLLAFAFSSVFLISYIVNHALHGDTMFPGHGPVRTLYLSILASHVILSIVALPMVLTTFFFSLTGRFVMHRRIARLTFPIWLYVSITGTGALPTLIQTIKATVCCTLPLPSQNLETSGDLACDSGADFHETLTTIANGAKIATKGSYIIIFKRQPNGSWQIVWYSAAWH